MSETVDVNLTSRKPLDTLVPLLSLGCIGAMCFRMYQLEVRVGELEKESDNHDKMTSFTPIQRPKPTTRHDRPHPSPPPPPPPAYRDDRRRREEVYHEAEEDLHDIDEDDEEEEGLPPTDPSIESDSKAKTDPDGKHE